MLTFAGEFAAVSEWSILSLLVWIRLDIFVVDIYSVVSTLSTADCDFMPCCSLFDTNASIVSRIGQDCGKHLMLTSFLDLRSL